MLIYKVLVVQIRKGLRFLNEKILSLFKLIQLFHPRTNQVVTATSHSLVH